MRIERIVLKHHGNIARHRLDLVDAAVINEEIALRDGFQAGNHPQQRGFATARGANQHNELAVANIQIDAVHGSEPIGIDLSCVVQRNRRHDITSPFPPDL